MRQQAWLRNIKHAVDERDRPSTNSYWMNVGLSKVVNYSDEGCSNHGKNRRRKPRMEISLNSLWLSAYEILKWPDTCSGSKSWDIGFVIFGSQACGKLVIATEVQWI